MKNRKRVLFNKYARKALNKLSEEVQNEIIKQIKILEKYGKLSYPDAKKISPNLFEIRIKILNQYRCFYAYLNNDMIIILHIFIKKTQKTLIKDINIAKKRIKNYE